MRARKRLDKDTWAAVRSEVNMKSRHSVSIIVVAAAEGPLDRFAHWPNWQRDLHNTGKVAGGR